MTLGHSTPALYADLPLELGAPVGGGSGGGKQILFNEFTLITPLQTGQ